MVKAHFGDGNRLGLQVDYLRGNSPLGTAGSLSLLDPLPDAPFVVTNGYVITDIRYGDMLDFYTRYAATATMAVCLQEGQHPFGVVKAQGVEIRCL
jgi:NDP-sugar pyrophosphorylase family protein